MTDNEAMERIKNGDRSALGALYERYKVSLYTYAYHQLNDRFYAEEIVQNTFFKVLKYADNYRLGSNFKAWLYTIGRNLLRDHYRKTKSNDRLKEIVTRQYELKVDGPDASANLMAKDNQNQLWSLLRKLDPEKREVLVLVKLHGMKYKEVSELLDVEPGYLRIIVFRAMKELQQLVSQYSNKTVD